MLQTKYQGSRPCGIRQEDFSHFLYISKLGRGSLGDAKYQISIV